MNSEAFRNQCCKDAESSFALNDSSLSDRIIQLEITKYLDEVFPNIESGSTSAEQTSLSKRRREDIQKNNVNVEGDEAANADDTANLHMDYSVVVKVKTLYVNSSLLASKSSFFYKLFFNGMKESKQTNITVRITTSEEVPFMELLKFMYTDSLNVTSLPSMLDVLMAADKFRVASCVRYCIRVLLNIPMTPESAVLYLELPYSVLMDDVIRRLVVAAKQYLVARYKDITKHQEELMGLPLAGVLALLSSDELQVASEDVVFDFMLKWARTQYPSLEERRQILRAKLIPFIRFPYLSCRKLKMFQTCNDFDRDFASRLVFEALHFKAETPHQQRIIAAELASPSRFFIERSYKYRPIKVVEFELPRKQCVVYLDLKRKECANLFPSGCVSSQVFYLGGQGFFLSAHCGVGRQSFSHCLGLFLGMQGNGPANFSVDFEFAVRSKPTIEYITKYKGNFTFTEVPAVSYRNFFCIPWTSFMAEDSLYFINDVLHLRVEVTIKNQPNIQ